MSMDLAPPPTGRPLPQIRLPRGVAILAALVFANGILLAQESEPETAESPGDVQESPGETDGFGDEIDVVERGDDMVGIAVSATEGSTGRVDLSRRALLRSGDVVETVPGMVATQHSGGGKANQYFIRGFNLDHGTDFSISVDGVPVNMPTHGHGQGYADMNFLIPELIQRARYRKGPYWAGVGDFSTAGSLDIDLIDRLPESLISVSAGSNSYGRLLFADSFEVENGTLLAAIEGFHDDGPYDRPEDFRVARGLLRYSQRNGDRRFSLTAMGYDGEWLSSDQIPQRAVDDGSISRFGLIDPGPRGTTQRFSLSAEALRPRENGGDRLSAYVMSYDFSLVGNFTYFLDNPELGDQVLQRDDRFVAGAELSRSWLTRLWRRPLEVTSGVQVRYDDLTNQLDRTRVHEDRIQLFAPVLRADVELITGGPFIEGSMRVNDWFRWSGGVRLDGYQADVASDRAVNSGSVSDTLISPKLSLAFGPWKQTEIYVNYGRGFHSNDAKGAVITVDPSTGDAADRAEPLVATEGFDVGFRTTAIPGLQSTVTLFSLELGSELIFVGDAGVTEAGRPSRRLGVEWTNHYQVSPVLWTDFDATWTDAEFRDDDPAGREIPGSVGRTLAAGLSFSNDGPWSASLRWRYFGDIPLVEDGSRIWSSSATFNGQVGYRFENGLELSLEGFNLTDREDDDVQYYYASRLPGEPADGIEDIHFHPLPERSLRLSLTWQP